MKKGHIITRESGVEWTDYALNHYLGCAHNCSYCYAKDKLYSRWVNNPVLQRAWGISPTRPWVEVEAFENTLEQLELDLKGLKPGRIMVSSTTDPYQPIERRLGFTRRVLEVLLDTEHAILICTKSPLVVRDYSLLERYDNVQVIFTLTHIYPLQARHVGEVSAPSVVERIAALKEAHDRGIPTGVSLEPWFPGIHVADIINSLKPWVDWWIIGSLNYHGDHSVYYCRAWPSVEAALEATAKPYLVKKELREILGLDKPRLGPTGSVLRDVKGG
jgi:DNA repair photolyase